MKKLFFAGALVLGTLSIYSCDSNTGTATGDNEKVIDADTTVSEVQVEKTTVDMDTSTTTETIDTDNQ
ncbi:hypothetical protein [Pontibacter chitinilyticus]|uniref:hypothetical protein n=1 Tax=Pontibacter chitinilyticus TaxID=2674989 RepID=UPI00321991CF